MGTKNTPGPHDCYANAEPNEPMFVLLARDASAPDLVRYWADQRLAAIQRGEKPATDMAMVYEARECAGAMELYRAGLKAKPMPAGCGFADDAGGGP